MKVPKTVLHSVLSVAAAAASLLTTTGRTPTAWVNSSLDAAKARVAAPAITALAGRPNPVLLLPAQGSNATAMTVGHVSHSSHVSHHSHYSHRSGL